jgi:hypothetical protein
MYMLVAVRAVWTLNLIVFAASAVGAVKATAKKTADAINGIQIRFIIYLPEKVDYSGIFLKSQSFQLLLSPP